MLVLIFHWGVEELCNAIIQPSSNFSGDTAMEMLLAFSWFCALSNGFRELHWNFFQNAAHTILLITHTCLHTHFMAGENETQRKGNVRFSFPDPGHFQQKLGIQQLVPCCNHCVMCLCLKVTTTAKSKAAELGGCWRICFMQQPSHRTRYFRKSCPSATSTGNRSKAQLAQHPLSNSGHKWVSKGRE